MSKPEKVAPVGTCDYCGKGIPVGEWWTSKGRPRLHCSLECRQAANSRKMENRAEWMRERIESGDWVNPATINKPTSETISKNSRAARLREVEEGRSNRYQHRCRLAISRRCPACMVVGPDNAQTRTRATQHSGRDGYPRQSLT